MKKAFFLLAPVCALSSLAGFVASAQTDLWRYRTGLRNSPGKQRLNTARKTGFLEMSFDEAGFLTLGDRTHYAGGSASARTLLSATVDGPYAFMLEAHDRAPGVAFAHLVHGYTLTNFQTKTQIETELLRLDFADFAHLRGDPQVVAAFDLGFAVLHELVHGVWQLGDAVGDIAQVGACDEVVNRIRRELNLPERQGYSPRLRPVQQSYAERTRLQAELVFVRTTQEANRTRSARFYLCWDEEQVGRGQNAAAQSGARTGVRATVR
jgi:hypothetical protein